MNYQFINNRLNLIETTRKNYKFVYNKIERLEGDVWDFYVLYNISLKSDWGEMRYELTFQLEDEHYNDPIVIRELPEFYNFVDYEEFDITILEDEITKHFENLRLKTYDDFYTLESDLII